MAKYIEIGKKLIIQLIVLIAVAWIISLIVSEIFNIKLKDFKLPNAFQPNIIVKIYKDKKKNTYHIDNTKEGFVSKRGKVKQRIKNPFANKDRKIEKFSDEPEIEEFTNCNIGSHYSNLYKSGIEKLDNKTKTSFEPYNNEDSGYTQTFIK